jgi:ABC-2 type transport system permease protein
VPKELLMMRRDPQRLAQLVYPLVIIGFLLYRTYARLPLAIGGNAALGTVFAPTLYIFLTLATVILLSAITLPVVNREGRSLYLLALAPLSARDILLSKWIVCVTPVLLLIEGILAAGAVLLQVEIVRALLIGLAMASLVVALGGAFLTVTLLWPRLEADNPRRQVSPAASFGALAVGVSLGGTVCLLLILTFVLWPLLPWLAIVTGLAIFLLTGAVTAAGLIAGSRLLQRLLGGEYLMRPS